MQRFSSDLRTNLHFHLVSLDGAFGTDARGQRRFETAPAPSPDDVEAILRGFLHRARALLDAGDDAPPDDEDQLALAHTLAAASARQDAEAHAPDDVAERDGPLHLPTRRKGPRRAPGVAPRAPVRPARQARRGAIVGRWRRGATPRAGMQRRPNAGGGSERT
jgi:hypothetical protein